MSAPRNVSITGLTRLVRVYFVEIAKGLWLTAGHLFRNLLDHKKNLPTISYPEERHLLPKGYRGVHRLTLRPDGRVRCTACYLCATACPANCIHIEAAETDDATVEKYPARYEIDELRCVMCGLCVEACPCDAIRMDTGKNIQVSLNRRDLLLEKERLMSPTSYDNVPLRTNAQGTHPKEDAR